MKVKAYAVIDADTNEFYSHYAGGHNTYFTEIFENAVLYSKPKTAQKKSNIPRNRKTLLGDIVSRDLKVVRVTLDVKLEDLG